MAKLLVSASLLMQLASAILLSLGILTPELVRAAGNRVAGYILTPPRGLLLKRAHARIIGMDTSVSEKPTGFKEGLVGLLMRAVERCSVEFMAFVVTFVLATILTLSSVFCLSVWGLVSAILNSPPRALLLTFSISGLIISASGACALFGPSERPAIEKSPYRNLLLRVLRVVSWPWNLTQPLLWLALHLVAVFTVVLPLAWYRCLKAVHRRGVMWAANLIGLALFVVSIALQLSALALAP